MVNTKTEDTEEPRGALTATTENFSDVKEEDCVGIVASFALWFVL